MCTFVNTNIAIWETRGWKQSLTTSAQTKPNSEHGSITIYNNVYMYLYITFVKETPLTEEKRKKKVSACERTLSRPMHKEHC